MVSSADPAVSRRDFAAGETGREITARHSGIGAAYHTLLLNCLLFCDYCD